MMLATAETAGHLSDRHFRSIAEFIEGQVGIKLPTGKRLMLEGRLQKRVRALNYSDLNEYVDYLFGRRLPVRRRSDGQ
jgi:chemotaxis protein methyltransferase CheR